MSACLTESGKTEKIVFDVEYSPTELAELMLTLLSKTIGDPSYEAYVGQNLQWLQGMHPEALIMIPSDDPSMSPIVTNEHELNILVEKSQIIQ